MALHDRLKEARRRMGMSQELVAERLGISRQAVTKWELGQGLPDIHLVEPLAGALDVSIAEIMRGEKNAAGSSDDAASLAAKNVIRLVEMKREEHKKISVVIAVAALLVFCALLLDVMGPIGFMGVALPGFGLTAGIVLACIAVIRRRRNLPSKATVVWAAVLIAFPVILATLFFMAGILGIGPVSN